MNLLMKCWNDILKLRQKINYVDLTCHFKGKYMSKIFQDFDNALGLTKKDVK